MNFENLMLREINQTQKVKQHMIPLIRNLEYGQSLRDVKQVTGFQGLGGEGEMGSYCLLTTLSFGVMKMFCKFHVTYILLP